MSYNAKENPARKRIDILLDEGSFVEIGGEVTARNTDFNLSAKETPSDGVITGYGVIGGDLVYVFSQDSSVLSGAIGEMHAGKISNLYDMAMKMGAPVIGLIDCAGLRLQEATDALEAFGRLYHSQSMASGVIPQIAAIFGKCGGGLAVAAGLCDFAFMEEKNARLYVNSPNVLLGNHLSKRDTSSAEYQSTTTGLVDAVGEEEDILNEIRTLIGLLPTNNEDAIACSECTDDLNRLCPDLDAAAEDPALALSMISDDNFFFETKRNYAKNMVTGFIKLNGMTVGAVANRAKVFGADGETLEDYGQRLSLDGCKKAYDFVDFCDAFSIPLLTLTNVTGFEATVEAEKDIAKEAARLTYAFVNADVPKVNVITKKAYGSAYVVMNSKSSGADIVYAWPDSEIGMMNAPIAVKIMYPDADVPTLREKTEEYRKLQSNPFSAARRGYVDAVIAPEDTRKYLIGAFEMLFTKRESRPGKKHGTV